jgi:phage-related protein
MMGATPKEVRWIASSLKELCGFPSEVQRVMGFALFLAQTGDKHPSAKPLRGFHGSGVLEIIDDFDGDAFRTVYTVRFEDVVYVLHAFQKKSKRGIATPKREMDLVQERYEAAMRDYAQRPGSLHGGPK